MRSRILTASCALVLLAACGEDKDDAATTTPVTEAVDTTAAPETTVADTAAPDTMSPDTTEMTHDHGGEATEYPRTVDNCGPQTTFEHTPDKGEAGGSRPLPPRCMGGGEFRMACPKRAALANVARAAPAI